MSVAVDGEALPDRDALVDGLEDLVVETDLDGPARAPTHVAGTCSLFSRGR